MQISKSWRDLAPRGNGQHSEPPESYLNRIRLNDAYDHIPDEVFTQWIYPHHRNDQTLQNYAWLDYTLVRFDTEEWDFVRLNSVNLIPLYQNMREGIDHPLENIPLSEQPFWAEQGTWRVPPIVLDVHSLTKNRPAQAVLVPPYQLVEGHSRFRNLLISHHQKRKSAPLHQLYVMRGGE
jgi:hypothetical protein